MNNSFSPPLRNHGSFSSDEKIFKVESTLTLSYSLEFVDGLLNPENRKLADTIGGDRVIVIIDDKVVSHFGEKIEEYFSRNGIDALLVPLSCGEANKNLESALAILDRIESFGVLRRSEPVVAVGGGVLLDAVGFAASIYRRGVPYIRIPTTLMAMIDACLGVKTGINFLERRNRLGSYFAPLAALIDTAFLETLAEREVSNGAGEILKLATIKDKSLFALLEADDGKLVTSKFQNCGETGNKIIHKSVKGMLEELAPNMWELDLERAVDFGHSFSPLIEMNSIPELLHGEAVALDVLFSCIISHLRGWLSKSELERVLNVCKSLNLPTYHPSFSCKKSLLEALEDTKRHRNGKQNLPLPKGIGEYVFINDLSEREIIESLNYMRKLALTSPSFSLAEGTTHV